MPRWARSAAACTCGGGSDFRPSGSAPAGSPSSSWPTPTPPMAATSTGSTCSARATGRRPTMADPLATWGGWAPAIRDDPFRHFAEARSRCPVQQARLADGHPAWIVLGYDAARQALNDAGISKDMLAALREDGDVVAEGLPGPEFSRHMLNVDPPDHTRLRRLVARAFAPARIAALEPAIRAIAASLLGVPAADRPRLHAWFQILLTGWAGDPPPAAVEASDGIVSYLRDLVEAKR